MKEIIPTNQNLPKENISIEAGSQNKGSDQKHCFACGKLIHMSTENCPACGAKQPVSSDLVNISAQVDTHPNNPISNACYCSGCGNPIHAEAKSCPSCGAPQKRVGKTTTKSKSTAVILALFLGGLGIHKFYLEQFGWGLIYLIFCWTFIPAVIGFLEAFVYLSHSDEEFSRRYG